MIGSLRRKAKKEVRKHLNANAAFEPYRRNLASRALIAFIGGRGLLFYFFCYFTFVAVSAVVVRYLFDGHTLQLQTLTASHDVLLGVQATILGLLLPVPLALVSLFYAQRPGTRAHAGIQVYYNESRSRELAASSIFLLAAILAHKYLDLHDVFSRYTPLPNENFWNTGIYAFHSTWLLLNIIGVWHFMRTTFAFVRPDGRKDIVKKFVANEGAQQELEQHYTHALLADPFDAGLIGHDDVSSPSESAGHEVTISRQMHYLLNPETKFGLSRKGTYELVDVWFTPLRLVVLGWRKRAKQHEAGRTLALPLTIGKTYTDKIVYAQGSAEPALTFAEKLCLRFAYRFKRIRL